MQQAPILTIVGNVATDVKYVPSDYGTPWATFRLAATRRKYDREREAWVDGQTTFLTVKCWRALADNVSSSINKGDPVVVIGALRVEPWTRDGRSGTSVEVDASTVGHDLARGTSAFRRTRRSPGPAGEPSEAEAVERLVRGWEDDLAASRDPRDSDVGGADAGSGAPPTHRTDSGRDPWAVPSDAGGTTDGRAA